MPEAFTDLPTPLVADACMRCGVPLRAAHPGIRAVVAGQQIAGRVLPVRHYGSVDVFLEAFNRAEAGDVLVIDNGGRVDEACIGDLAVLEAGSAGVAGLVVWGLAATSAGRRSAYAPWTGGSRSGGGSSSPLVATRVSPARGDDAAGATSRRSRSPARSEHNVPFGCGSDDMSAD